MKIGLISDVHGNLVGLETCLKFMNRQKTEKIYFLGDLVGYFPDPLPVLNCLIDNQIDCLMGNHDAMLLNKIPLDASKDKIFKIGNLNKKIDKYLYKFLENLNPSKSLILDNLKILLVHGSPWNEFNGYIYPNSDLKAFSQLDYDFVFMGHTHRPFISTSGRVTVVNVGSCGLPRDIGNLVSCVLFDSESRQVEIFRIPIDVNKIIKSLKGKLHPNVIDCLLRSETDVLRGTIANV